MADNGEHGIMPEMDYDPTEAKFCACLFWLIFHATEDGDFGEIPPEITCPTERDLEERFVVRSNVASFLCQGEVYIKVCSQVFKSEEISEIWDVIQMLSKEGFYVIDSNDDAVTEERLFQNDEFDLDAHLAMMDILMMAHVNKSIEIQDIVTAVSSFASFNAAKELPFDLEDALLLWLNKINTVNERQLKKSRSPETSSSGSPGRFRFKRDQVLEKSQTLFPKLDDLQADLANGKALLSLLLFYFPEALSHESIKSSDPMSQNDIICNIELFRELCAQHVCTSVFALRTEDFIYKAPELKNNVIGLLTEIFVVVELEKVPLDIVDNRECNDKHYDTHARDIKLENRAGVIDDYQKEAEVSAKENLNPNDCEIDLKRSPVFENDGDERNYIGEASSRADSKKVNNIDWNGLVENSHTADDLDRSIMDRLQKLKTLSSTKKGLGGKERVDLEEQRGTIGIEKEKSGADTKTRLEGSRKPNSVVKSRQPLLSKRSKKQLKNLGDEERSFSQEDLSGVHLVDFDLKRSHSLTSVVGKSNYSVDPSKSFKAWGQKEYDEPPKQKGQKISLDFKPDTAAYRRQTPTADPLKIGTDSYQKSDIGLKKRQELNENTKEAHDRSHYDTYKSESGIKSPNDQLNTTNESLESSSSDELGNFRAEILEHTQKIDNKCDVKADFEEPQFEDDDLFTSGQFVNNMKNKQSPVVLGHGQSPRPNKLLGLDAKQNLIQRPAFVDEHLKDIDDDLSTIAEISEPSTPTVYSFQTDRSCDGSENSRTVGTDDGMRGSHDDSQSPTVVSQDVTPFNSMDDINLLNVLDNSVNEFQFASASKQKRVLAGNLQENEGNRSIQCSKSSCIAPGVSYTVLSSDMSLEAAKAAGLPIIDNRRLSYDKDADTFDPAVSEGNVEGLKSDEGALSSEGSQENGEFVVAEWDIDGTAGQIAGDPVDRHQMRTTNVDYSLTNATDSYSKENKTFDAFQGDFAFGKNSVSRAFLQSERKSILDTEVLASASNRNVENDLRPSDQSEAVNDMLLLSEGLGPGNRGSATALDASEGKANSRYFEACVDDPRYRTRKERSEKLINGAESYNLSLASLQSNADANSTITWSEIQTEMTSSTRNVESPMKGKSCAVTTVGDGPVINWADYAKKRELENDVHESEDDTGTPRGFLAPRLAMLKMQLEEKRRHIEEEKRKMKEQWTEERAKLGQQAFWLAVGRETKEELERTQMENEAALEARRKKKPGLTFIPFSDANDPAKVLTRPRRKRNVTSPLPNECSSPVTPFQQSRQRSNGIVSTNADYPVHENHIGSGSIMEASRRDKETFIIDKKTSDREEPVDISNPDQLYDSVFMKDPEMMEKYAVSRGDRTSPVSDPLSGHVSVEENKGDGDSNWHHARDPDASFQTTGAKLSSDRKHRTAWTEPHVINPADFPIIANSELSVVIDSEHSVNHLANQLQDIRGPVATEADNSPKRQEGNTQHSAYDAELGIMEPPGQELEDVKKGNSLEKGVALMIPLDDAVSQQDDSRVNAGEDLQTGLETLTPEQQKKREKFIQHRIRRQQEEKAKRGAELEKKRKREEKLKERKAAMEKKERDEQERLRRQRQEEEDTRKREDEELERRISHRFPKKEEQWYGVALGKQGKGPGSTRSGGDDVSLSSGHSTSTLTEYNGPPVYVKPAGKSNRQIIINAISYCCLSGEVNREAKERSLQMLAQSNAAHFFVLFRDGLKFRGLYAYSQEIDEAHKIYGLGPKVIVNRMIERLFKYSSGAKAFSQIHAKSLSIQVDGFQIKKEFWQSTKTQPPSKTDSNFRKGSSTSRVDHVGKGSYKPIRR